MSLGKAANGRLKVTTWMDFDSEASTMFLTFNDRPSDSRFVERVWRSQSHSAGVFLSVAASHFEIAVTRHKGRIFLTVRGPETKATPADCPAEGEWLGIR